MKLNQVIAATLPPRANPYIQFDKDPKSPTGFGCRVSPGGTRTWVFGYRPAGGGRRAPWKVITLGRIEDLPYHKARTVAERQLHETKLGADPAAARNEARTALTVDELADKFLAEIDAKRKPSTAKLYRKHFASYIRPTLGHKRARDVTYSDCAKLHLGLGARAPVVANRTKTLIVTLYNWAGKVGHLPKDLNPAREIDNFREQARERFLTTDELARLGDALAEAETIGLEWTGIDETKPGSKHLPKVENRREVFPRHVTAAFRLLILTGCRRGEILNAKWTDIDWERAQLVLPDSKTGARRVPLSAAALAVLNDLEEIGTYIVASATAGMRNEAPRADLNRPWRAIAKRAGLEGVRVHDLRHSFASVGAGLGLGLPIVGKLLGHTQSSTTARYAHLDVDPLRRATDHIGATIDAALNRRRGADIKPLKGATG